MPHSMTQKGFSLTELSVVLVIVAFIIAGVLEGNNLIKGAHVKSIISESQSFIVALNSFSAKYNKGNQNVYPGDFDEGDEYWNGSLSGDGNGQIEFINGAGIYEGYVAWQHLSYAGMIDDPYVGTRTTGVPDLDTDIPRSRTDGGYYFDYEAFGLTGSNVLVLGDPINLGVSATSVSVDGNLTPEQAQDVDAKSDDGSPLKGSVRGADGENSTNESCVDAAENIYVVTLEGNDCILGFRVTSQ